jgi:hypothetical protein
VELVREVDAAEQDDSLAFIPFFTGPALPLLPGELFIVLPTE